MLYFVFAFLFLVCFVLDFFNFLSVLGVCLFFGKNTLILDFMTGSFLSAHDLRIYGNALDHIV